MQPAHPVFRKLFPSAVALFFLQAAGMAFAAPLEVDDFVVKRNRAAASTKGHPKAKGLDMVYYYPRNWVLEEGQRPNIPVKTFSKGVEPSRGCMLIIRTLPAEAADLSKADIADIFSPRGMREMLGGHGKVWATAPTTVDSLPGAWGEYSQDQDIAGTAVRLRGLLYMAIYKTYVFNLTCMVGAKGGTSDAEMARLYKEYEPVFKMVGVSIVVNSHWNS